MRWRSVSEFWRDQGAAIAPLYALSLFGLIVMAGVGWDYGRMMAMDSELQNAADQAALAAATQLDGRDGAIDRAETAARDFLATADSEWVNITVMANDGDGREITDLSFRFFESYDSAADTFGPETADDGDAGVVMVTVNGREAFFALTAVVDAFSSGDIEATAVAGLQTATCNVPPLMFCAPTGDSDFPSADDVGKALRMHMRANEADVWAPGNFGFLDIEYSDTPTGNPNTTMGWNSDFLGCAGESVESRTGFRVPETRALNTRFDRYDNAAPNCNTSTGDFCPAENVRRDWVRIESRNNVRLEDIAGLTCDSSGSGTWTAIEDLPAEVDVDPQGMPADSCFASGTCASFGDGSWDGAGYMLLHHGATTLSSVPDLDGNGTVSRYEVYEWEKDASTRTDPKMLDSTQTLRPNGRYDVQLYCSYSRPVVGTPVVADATQKDRRLITVASVDCSGLSGHGQVDIIRWVDMFLLSTVDENEADRSFTAEIVGPSRTAAGNAGFQYYGRNKPVLLR